MSVGIFTGTVQTIERRHTQEEDFICTVWLNLVALGSQSLRATAWNELAKSMAEIREGDTITISGLIDTEVQDRPDAKQKVLLLKIKQVGLMNQIVLTGRAGADPEMRRFENRETGEPSVLAKFTLAVNKPRQSEEPNWFALEFWGRNAEVVEEFVKKGSLIGVVGSVKIDAWKDRSTGRDRAQPVVLVERLELLGSKREEESPANDQPIANLETDSSSQSAEESITPSVPATRPRKSRKSTTAVEPITG